MIEKFAAKIGIVEINFCCCYASPLQSR